MARKILELNTEDGDTILVAVDIPEVTVNRVGIPGELPIEKVDQSFDAVKALIVQGCRPFTQAFQALHQEMQTTNAEVEFGVSFTTKGLPYVVENIGESSLKVKITWNPASGQ